MNCQAVRSLIRAGHNIQSPHYIEAIRGFPGLHIVVCCRDTDLNSIKGPLSTIPEIDSAKRAAHCVAMECRSLIETLIRVEGCSKSGHIQFKDYLGTAQADFDEEGSSINLGHSPALRGRCGEISVEICTPTNSVGVDEYIEGKITVFDVLDSSKMITQFQNSSTYMLQLKS